MVDTDEPRLELDELRATAHAMVDLMVDYLGRVGDGVVFPAGEPAAVAALFEEPPPLDPQPVDRIDCPQNPQRVPHLPRGLAPNKLGGSARVGEIRDKLLPFSTHVGHPGCSKDFVPAVRPPMSAICLRWVGGGAPSPERQAALHREVARRVQDGGRFWISTTVLKGQAHFRINPVNFGTRAAHMDALLEELRATCQAVARDGGGGPPGPVEA